MRDSDLRGRRFLFLSGIDGAPLQYRVWNLVGPLEDAGATCQVLYHSDAGAVRAAAECDALVLFRAPYSYMVAEAVAAARRRNAVIVFSADDLVFRPDAPGKAPALEDNRPGIATGFRETLDWYARSLTVADSFLGTTDALVAAAEEVGIAGYLLRNSLGRNWSALARQVLRVPGLTESEAIIGFLSGTDTHDPDLAMIAKPLVQVLKRFPRVGLLVAGPVRVPERLLALGARLERRPTVSWNDLLPAIASLRVSVAPLELSRPFNLGKSEVKYLEAASLGIPTVASPSPAFISASKNGATALLADGESDWGSALEKMVADSSFAIQLGGAARDAVQRSSAVYPKAVCSWATEALSAGHKRASRSPAIVDVEGGDGSSVALEPQNAWYDRYQFVAESGIPLGPGAEVEQVISCRGHCLFRIDILVGTYVRRNSHPVTFIVSNSRGRRLGYRIMPAARMVNQTFVSVDLEANLTDLPDRLLIVRVKAERAAPGNQILLWHGPFEHGELSIGGQRLPGRGLAFRAFGGSEMLRG